MKKLFLLLIILILIPSISAMQQEAPPPAAQQQMPGWSPLDALPREIRILILRYVASADTLDKAVKGIKEFYIASPESRKSIEINQAILRYLMQRFIDSGTVLKQAVNNLNTFPAFKDPAMIGWIEKEQLRLDNENDLRIAARVGNLKKVQELITQGVDVNAKNANGDTALINTVLLKTAEGEIDQILSLLIKSGAHVNLQNNQGKTALYVAAQWGYDNALKILLDNGADATIRSLDGSPLNKVLHVVGLTNPNYFRSYMKIIEMLLKAGSDANEKINNKSFLEIVKNQNALTAIQKKEIIELLKKYGAK
jgi:hypothetical protein